MLTHKAYRFRIYPTAEQEVLFRRTIGCCRLVYNLCLDQKKLERERSDPRRLTAFDQIKELTALSATRSFCGRYHTTLWCNRSWTCIRRSRISSRVGRAFRSSAERRDGCSFDFYLSVDKVTDLSVI